MLQNGVSEAILSRVPGYIAFLENYHNSYISATIIASELNYGEVMVRKDLAKISTGGKPKIGYEVSQLLNDLKSYMGYDHETRAAIVGMGRLGKALYHYNGFDPYHIKIVAAFDLNNSYEHIHRFKAICKLKKIDIGIITVPKDMAQSICDLMVESNIKAIWNFAPVILDVPKHIIVKNENMACSLSVLAKLTHDRK
ncbi:hypothetical protein BK011_02295 [Tenericutes bacterium MZ-XQ]|nr:hypothetical protein BK011_02295 [Tenericutes bacterium MZ-XQ]